jgi:hypothetical protein
LTETTAFNCVAPTKVVPSAAPFHCTTAPEAKAVPFTVIVNAGPPAAVEDGLNDVIVGTTVALLEAWLPAVENTVLLVETLALLRIVFESITANTLAVITTTTLFPVATVPNATVTAGPFWVQLPVGTLKETKATSPESVSTRVTFCASAFPVLCTVTV